MALLSQPDVRFAKPKPEPPATQRQVNPFQGSGKLSPAPRGFTRERLRAMELASTQRIRKKGIVILKPPEWLIFGEYLIQGLTLAATDAGTTATITVSSFMVYWPDKPNGVPYVGGNIANLNFSTNYAVFLDNPDRTGGKFNLNATVVGADILRHRRLEGRLHIGNITTPADAAGDTAGSAGGSIGTTAGVSPPNTAPSGPTIFNEGKERFFEFL